MRIIHYLPKPSRVAILTSVIASSNSPSSTAAFKAPNVLISSSALMTSIALAPRKLPPLRDKQRVELSGRILAGGSNETITIYRNPDYWDIEGS